MMRITLKLVENNLGDKIPAIFILAQDGRKLSRYLINVPSTLQRYHKEKRISFSNQVVFFFTKSSSEVVSGFSSLLFSLSESQRPYKSRFYVSPKLFDYFQQMRYKVSYLMTSFSYYSWDGKIRRGISDSSLIMKMRKSEDYLNNFHKSEEYIDRNIDLKDQIDASKYCKKNGYEDQNFRVKPIQIEAKGEEITHYVFQIQPRFIDERMDKQNEKKEAKSFVVFHFNSVESIEKTTANENFNKFLALPNRNIISCIFIGQSTQVVLSQEFSKFVQLFPEAEHVIFNRQIKNKQDSYNQIFKFHRYIHVVSKLSEEFPKFLPNLLFSHNKLAENHYKKMKNVEDHFNNALKIKAYKQDYELTLHPSHQFGYHNMKKIIKEPLNISPLRVEHAPVAQNKVISTMLQVCDPKVIFLGTSSMKSSLYRNVSSIMVEIENIYCMFDCGEGSYSQLYHHFAEKTEQTLLKMRILFVSHFHSDHTFGIMDLISQRNKVLKKMNKKDKIFVVIPSNVMPWIHRYSQIIEDISESCEFVFIQHLRSEKVSIQEKSTAEMLKQLKSMSCKGRFSENDEEKIRKNLKFTQTQEQSNNNQIDYQGGLQPQFYKEDWIKIIQKYQEKQKQSINSFKQYYQSINLLQFDPIPVIHCLQSYGIILKHKSGVKISYSGDTRPCAEFIQAAKDSTLMIHQATCEENARFKANQTLHSTVREAINVGIDSKSWKTALTHFGHLSYYSGTHFQSPVLNKMKKAYVSNNVFLAVDHLQCKFTDLPLLPFYSPRMVKMISQTTQGEPM